MTRKPAPAPSKSTPLQGATIVVGVTGSIAAYKAADLVSRLTKEGADVHCVLSPSAQEFITPLTLQTLSRNPCITGMFAGPAQWDVAHVALADCADVVVIAPATANTIAHIALGLADDMLTSLVLATNAPVLVAPAMNVHMLEHLATRANLERLQAMGYGVIDPEEGMLACGYEGPGRLAGTECIIERIAEALGRAGGLAGRKVVVTAGPTREPIDAVRFISNASTGKMGYALATAARLRGARVTLVSGPSSLLDPAGVEVVRVGTAREMLEATVRAAAKADVAIGAAAPADYAPARPSPGKLPKAQVPAQLALEPTPDILAELGKRKGKRILVGFAAETEDIRARARKKLEAKRLDLIFANDVSRQDAGFATDTNAGVLIHADGRAEEFAPMSKWRLADCILAAVAALIRARG
jgi:phosphopantothenoylcysteine decarboxylase/phosphopantothenate--cysteine ligase